MDVRVKRVYEAPAEEDGFRVLVDRLWPRGVSKEQAEVDLWLKEIAPSNELRKWFGHAPERWDEFKHRYFQELDERPQVVEQLKDRIKAGHLTLVYSARDPEHNQAVALKAYLERKA